MGACACHYISPTHPAIIPSHKLAPFPTLVAPSLTKSLHLAMVLFQTVTLWPALRRQDTKADPIAPRPMKPKRRDEGDKRSFVGDADEDAQLADVEESTIRLTSFVEGFEVSCILLFGKDLWVAAGMVGKGRRKLAGHYPQYRHTKTY